jgi:Zn-dependent M16 (insulinase) family peptidase
MALPQNTTTIEALVESGKSVTAKYSNFSYLEEASNGSLVAVKNVIWDYIDELKNASIMVKLTDKEFYKYQYRPKRLCYDVYGNTEIDFVIMAINNIADVTEFDSKTLRMLKVEDMQELITLIYNAERKAIENYNSKITG